MNEASQAGDPAPRSGLILLGIFLISVATLQLEILQTRIFSVLLWHHVTYLVVTFTLLGFAASGTFVSLAPRLLERRPTTFLTTCSLAFCLTTLGAFSVLGRSQLDTLELLEDRAQYFVVFVYYLYLVVPFFFAGAVIVGGLKVAGKRTNLTYSSNLAGSAIGCLLFAWMLRLLGGEGSVLLGAGVAGLGALCFALAGRHRLATPVSALAGFGCLALIPLGEKVLPFEAAPTKVMVERMDRSREAGRDPSIEATEWDPLCRIDVVDLDDGGPKAVYQDADAPTSIHPGDRPVDRASFYTFPYFVRAKQCAEPEVMIIGVGGGQDVRYALQNDASHVVGVEINRTTADLMRGAYREFSGNVYNEPGPTDFPTVEGHEKVEIIEAEGRSFVRRSDRDFDLIQMTGTDTYAALSSGSYVLSESYLYTVEAFEDFLGHLKPGGMISVLRFRFFPARETIRLVGIAVEAMRRRGVERPQDHVMVLDQVRMIPDPEAPNDPSRARPFAYSVMLFKESPFGADEIEAAHTFVKSHPNPALHKVVYAPGEDAPTPEERNEFQSFLAAVAEGEELKFQQDYTYRITPVGDDSPFFFNFHRWGSVFGQEGDEASPDSSESGENAAGRKKRRSSYMSAIGDDPVGLFLLGTALIESAALVVLLVLAPLVLSRRTALPRRRRGPVFLYFLGLGVGFLFLEIACMQRLSLYLGHPTRSITVVLFSFLLFSGLGAAVAARLDPRRAATGGLLAIVGLIAVYALFLGQWLDATLGWSTGSRIVFAGAVLAVPAFFMGMPFPCALSRLRGEDAPFLPWAFAINGGASVVASVAAIFLAMAFGFTAVFWIALGCYALAAVSERFLPGSQEVPHGAG